MSEVIDEIAQRTSNQSDRRGFLGSLTAAVAAIVLIPKHARAELTPGFAHVSPSDAMVLSEVGLDKLVGLPPVPTGFALARTRSTALVGFYGVDRHALFVFHPLSDFKGSWAPIQIVAAHQPAGHFWRTQGREPSVFSLRGASGKVAQAEYHDGCWGSRPWLASGTRAPANWYSKGIHTVVVRTEQYALAASGGRSPGVDQAFLAALVGAMI